jgi:hypothetical protein
VTTTLRRRPLLASAGVAVVLFLLVLGWLGVTAYLARGHLLDVRSEVSRLQNDVSAGRTDRLDPGLASIRNDAKSAHRLTSDPVWWAAAHIPVLGRTFDASSGLAKAADQLADSALPQLVDAADQLDPAQVRRKDGSLELSRLSAASPHLAQADAALADARRTVADLPDTGVVAPVATARRQLDTQLGDLAGSLDAATRASRIGPAMLGADGPRRYLVMFQNPAEVRGTGGLAGSFAVIRADHGKLTRERTGSDTDLIDAPTPVVDLGPDFKQRWNTDVSRGWRPANASPHYPWAADIWAHLWQRQSGEQIDGVIAVDPIALGYLLQVTGPVTLSDGEKLTGDTVATWTLSTEYFKYGNDNDRRKQLLSELAQKAFDRISSGNGGSAALLKALGHSVDEHRVLAWAARPAEQAAILGTPLAGTVIDGNGPLAALILNNDGGNKLDYYTDRTLTYQVLSCATTDRTVRATITLTNRAPATGLPDYIGGRAIGGPAPLGTNRTIVNLYVSAGAHITGTTVDGKAAPLVVGTERGKVAFQVTEDIAAGQTRTIVYEYTEPRSNQPVTIPVQPMARKMTVRVDDRCP